MSRESSNVRRDVGMRRLLLSLGLGVALANAQYPVQQDGRLFDANPQVGGDRRNYERPAAPPLQGNAVAEGVAGRGFSLRTNIGIAEQNTFRGVLPSGGLSNFRRDSVSVADVSSPLGGLAARNYYDPSNTVGTLGFLRGGAGGNQQTFAPGYGYAAGSAAALDQRLDMRIPSTALTTGISGTVPGYTANVNFGDLSGDPALRIPGYTSRNSPQTLFERDTVSSLAGFGLRSSDMIPSLQTSDEISQLLNTNPSLPSTLQRRVGDATGDPRSVYATPGANTPGQSAAPFGPITALWRTEQRLGATLDRRVGEVSAPYAQQDALAAAREQRAALDANAQPTQTRAGTPQDVPITTAERVARPGGFANQVLPGNDLFTDLQIASALQRDPSPGWFEQMRSTARSDPALSQAYQEKAQYDSQAFLRLMRTQKIRTFASGAPSQLNQTILEAETALREKRYFEAVAQFDHAYALDPSNPLPLLGRGHAQLAAGEFMSAANSLILGLDRFTDIVNYDLDLQALMGSGELVDIRRSELMERLKQREDPALRFLLGYLEFFGGRRGSAMAQFESAAMQDRSGSIITRMPEILRASPAKSASPGTDEGPRGAGAPNGAGRTVIPSERSGDLIPRLPSRGRDRSVPTRFTPRWQQADQKANSTGEGAVRSGAFDGNAALPAGAGASAAPPPAAAPPAPRRPAKGLDIPRPSPVQLAPK